MVRDLSEHSGLSCRKPSFGASSSASLRGWARSTEFPRHWCVRQWHRITGGFRVSERDTMERCTQRADPVVIRVASNPEKYNGTRLPLPRGGHVLLGCPRRVDTVRSYPLRVSAVVRKRDTDTLHEWVQTPLSCSTTLPAKPRFQQAFSKSLQNREMLVINNR